MNHILETYVDGLDASTDGRGWGAEHEAARIKIENSLVDAQTLLCLATSPRFQNMTVKDALDELARNGAMRSWRGVRVSSQLTK